MFLVFSSRRQGAIPSQIASRQDGLDPSSVSSLEEGHSRRLRRRQEDAVRWKSRGLAQASQSDSSTEEECGTGEERRGRMLLRPVARTTPLSPPLRPLLAALCPPRRSQSTRRPFWRSLACSLVAASHHLPPRRPLQFSPPPSAVFCFVFTVLFSVHPSPRRLVRAPLSCSLCVSLYSTVQCTRRMIQIAEIKPVANTARHGTSRARAAMPAQADVSCSCFSSDRPHYSARCVE